MEMKNVIEAIEKRFAELKTEIVLKDIEIENLKKRLAEAENEVNKKVV